MVIIFGFLFSIFIDIDFRFISIYFLDLLVFLFSLLFLLYEMLNFRVFMCYVSIRLFIFNDWFYN